MDEAKRKLDIQSVKILISNSAFDDLESIKEYYVEQDAPEIGQNFVVSIFEHIQ